MNKRIETGKLMNALVHMSIGLMNKYLNEDFGFINYADKNEGVHIASRFPNIILKADNSNKIRNLINICIEKKIPFNSFTNCMTIGTWQEQVEKKTNL